MERKERAGKKSKQDQNRGNRKKNSKEKTKEGVMKKDRLLLVISREGVVEFSPEVPHYDVDSSMVGMDHISGKHVLVR